MKLPLGKLAKLALEWVVIPALVRAVKKNEVATQAPHLPNDAPKNQQIDVIKDVIGATIQDKLRRL